MPLLHDKLRTGKSRPTPPLLSLITHDKSKTEYARHFSITRYENVDWLAGCETTNFIAIPVYLYLTDMKYGINMTSQI
jgi:hypothetical protein